MKVSALFENIPAYLSTHEKKVVLSRVEIGATYAQYSEPLFWLDDSKGLAIVKEKKPVIEVKVWIMVFLF